MKRQVIRSIWKSHNVYGRLKEIKPTDILFGDHIFLLFKSYRIHKKNKFHQRQFQGRSWENWEEKYIAVEVYLRSEKYIFLTKKSITRPFLPEITMFINQMSLHANLKFTNLSHKPSTLFLFDALQNLNSRPVGGETH